VASDDERRLLIAKELLNPSDSVLIVTIDEKEYLRLGILLQQTFPGASMQMISTLINSKGTGRANEFRRVDEYIYLLWFGQAKLGRLVIRLLRYSTLPALSKEKLRMLAKKINKMMTRHLKKWALP